MHTFEFEESEYMRYPPAPWKSSGIIPIQWFEDNVGKFLYSPRAIIEESVPYKKNEGPWKSGIYFLIHDGEIIYVGKSVEIMRRLNEHREKGWSFNRFWCFGGIPEIFVEHVESFYIHSMCLPMNEKYPILDNVILPLVEKVNSGVLVYENT